MLNFSRLRFRNETEYRHEAAHDRADDIEEAERQIDEGRNAQDGALRHTAGGPRHEYRGYRGAIFRASTQQLGLVATCRILLLVDAGVHDDAEELVAHHEIEEHARCHGAANQRYGAVDALEEYLGDGMEHAARHHARTETHGAEDEPDGVEHTCHASGSYQLVDALQSAVYLGIGVAGGHDALEEALGGNLGLASYLHQHLRLKDEGADASGEGGEQEGDERRGLAIDEPACEDRHKHRPERDVEAVVETSEILGDFHRLAVVAKSDDEVEYQGDGHARHRGVEHVADMYEEVGSGDAGGEDGGVAHRRELVAEVGSRDDGSCGVRGRDAEGFADSHQGDADGGDGGPRGSGHHRDNRRDDAGAGQEEGRRHQLHTIIYQGRHYAANHPGG